MTKVCIVGGGNLAHVTMGMFSLLGDVSINLLTNRPECWGHEFTVSLPADELPSGWGFQADQRQQLSLSSVARVQSASKSAQCAFPKTVTARIERVSADPAEVVPGCDIVLLCLPAFLVEETVVKLAPFVDPVCLANHPSTTSAVQESSAGHLASGGTAQLTSGKVPIFGTIVANSGFFLFCHKYLSPQAKLFGFQRVPYVARVVEYGKSANLLGFRDELFMAIENIATQPSDVTRLNSAIQSTDAAQFNDTIQPDMPQPNVAPSGATKPTCTTRLVDTTDPAATWASDAVNTDTQPSQAFDTLEAFRAEISRLFCEKVTLVDSFYEVTLSNSNPILHTGRLYTMLKDWDGRPMSHCPLFYREWTDEASVLEVEMDREFFSLLKALKVDTSHVKTLLEHYEATDAAGMTRKLRSIESLSTILSPMKQTPEGWVPDYESRYFTEDFPFGLSFIKELSAARGLATPNIDKVLTWGLSKICRNEK